MADAVLEGRANAIAEIVKSSEDETQVAETTEAVAEEAPAAE